MGRRGGWKADGQMGGRSHGRDGRADRGKREADRAENWQTGWTGPLLRVYWRTGGRRDGVEGLKGACITLSHPDFLPHCRASSQGA